jgi:hypothetical protein
MSIPVTASLCSFAEETYIKWSGVELDPKQIHMIRRLLPMYFKFLQLGTPISSQILFRCALLTSSLVGAANNCMHRFDAPSSRVERMLMQRWAIIPTFLTLVQSPSCRDITPLFDFLPYLMARTRRQTTFMIRTIEEVVNAVQRTTLRFECHVRQPRALLCKGFTSGNQGDNSSIRPKRTSCRIEFSEENLC